MYVRFSGLLPVAALVASVAAGALAVRNDGEECSTGSIQCCTSTTTPDDPAISTLLGVLGVVPGNVAGLVGLGCSGLGSGATCIQEPVCCNGNSFNGVIVVGCSPITIIL